jgi:hypothetical protein
VPDCVERRGLHICAEHTTLGPVRVYLSLLIGVKTVRDCARYRMIAKIALFAVETQAKSSSLSGTAGKTG